MPHHAIRILLVEDNPGDARLVQELLHDGSAEFRVDHVDTVMKAVAHLDDRSRRYDAVLLDLSLPDETGVDTVRRVAEAATHEVVVVMTGGTSEEIGLLAMQEGAQDYLVKGQVDGRALRRALRYAIERQDIRRRLQHLSHNDELTGLYNRRGFLLLAEQHLKTARRNQLPFLLVFFDLDRLKQINDNLGHTEGNRAIVEAADVLRHCFRQSDVLARLGGDEFAALALNATEGHAGILEARLGSALDALNARPDRSYPLSFSLGILACDASEEATIEALLSRVDQLMYEEKKRKQQGGAAVGALRDYGALAGRSRADTRP